MTCQDFMPNSFTQTTASPIYKTTFPKWQQQTAATSPLLGSVPWRKLQRGGDGSKKIDLGEDVLWMCCFLSLFFSSLLLSLSLQPHGSLPALAWEIQMSKAAIPLHLGGVHSESSARSWTIWLRTKRIRKRSEFLCACSSRSVSGLSGCSVEDPSLTKIRSLCISEPLHKHKPLNFLLDQTFLPAEGAPCSCWNTSIWTGSLFISVSSGQKWWLLVHSWSSSSQPLACCQLVLWQSLNTTAAHPEQAPGLGIGSQTSQPLAAFSQVYFKISSHPASFTECWITTLGGQILAGGEETSGRRAEHTLMEIFKPFPCLWKIVGSVYRATSTILVCTVGLE